MQKIIGLGLVVFSLLGTVLCLVRKDEPFFNLRKVIENHLQLFKNCRGQYFVFYGFPLLFAVGLSLVYQVGASFYSELSVILGILLTMLMAMLSILGGYSFSTIKDREQQKRGTKGIEETINAIIFESILIIGLLLYGLTIIVVSGTAFPPVFYKVKVIISGLAYYVFFVILLNLLLIIKHMSNLIVFNLHVKRGNEDDSSESKK